MGPGLQQKTVMGRQHGVTAHTFVLVTLLPDHLQQNKSVVENALIRIPD